MSGSADAVRVVLMGAAPRGGPRTEKLETLLGAERRRELDRVLLHRARRWADSLVAPDAVRVTDRGHSGLADSVTELFRVGAAPVLVVWPELAGWRSEHADGALGDLAAGCDVSLGPMFHGGVYLVAFARPVAALLAFDDAAWNGPDPVGLAAEAAAREGLGLGVLRTERGLRQPADVRALLADPLLDDELRELLS